MKIRTRLLLAAFALASVTFLYTGNRLRGDVRYRYFQVLEDALNDMAVLAAGVIEHQLKSRQSISSLEFTKMIKLSQQKPLQANIFEFRKTTADVRYIITDHKGIVVYDSTNQATGRDYSRYNDIYLTLKGNYGARSSKDDSRYPGVSVKYVAAPLKQNGNLVGVVSLGKPSVFPEMIIQASRSKIAEIVILMFSGFIVISVIITILITLPLDKLIQYVRDLKAGKPVKLPSLGKSEIAILGKEFDELRTQLEGRAYLENMIQMLTHELKTPVAAISGAVEILETQNEPGAKKRFLGNIAAEAERIHMLTENLLGLAKLENVQKLSSNERFSLAGVVDDLLTSYQLMLEEKQLTTTISVSSGIKIQGDRFYFSLAVRNIIRNAIEFATPGTSIVLKGDRNNNQVTFCICNHGPHIPEFALDKIFEKFYSLGRPDGNKKGSGLGLPFAKLVIELHGGELKAENRENSKVCFTLTFRAAQIQFD